MGTATPVVGAVLCALAVARGAPARPRMAIVADWGRHPSAKAAAAAKVDWLDADTTDDAACTEAFAALELQRCLRTMTGRADDFAIRNARTPEDRPQGGLFLASLTRQAPEQRRALARLLGVDAKRLDALGREGYCIRTVKEGGRRSIHVVGGSRVGTLYGAYDLLHRLGCRWFAPGEAHEVVPRIGAIPDVEATETPSFRTRGFHAWEDRGDPEFLLWMARNRLNYWCVQQSDHPLVWKLGIQMSCGGHTAQSFFLNPYHAYPYDHPRFKGDEKRPKDPYPPSDAFRGDADKDGKLSNFEAHPEWFALVGGKRVPGYRGEFGTNYCTSNPHATTEFMKNYVQALVDGRYKDAAVVRFWTLDGGKWCQCAACKALGIPTDRNLLLVHRLDQEIKKARAAGRIHRPIIIRFLAYHDVLQPPTRPLPADFDYETCCATFFPIVRSYVRTFDDPLSPRNRRYSQQLHGWAIDPKRHYRGQLCIGEYYNVSGYKCLPICYMHTMAHDIPHYHTMGARHFHYMHVVTRNWGNKALTNYQMARQLWNAGTDCEALWTDYFARRYGAVAATMRRFYESLEKMLCNVSELKYGLARRLHRGSKGLFPSAQLRFERAEGVACNGPTLVEIAGHSKECRKLIGQALTGVLAGVDVPGDRCDRVAARIREDERLFTYGERTVAYFHACAQAFRLARAGQRDEARHHFAAAQGLAEMLRRDTASTRHSSSHANAANAFVATYATGAVAILGELLGPSKPAALKRFEPGKGPLVLTGHDFTGGGALRFGHGLRVFPGRIKVSDDGNSVYARPTGAYSRMSAWFRVAELPTSPLTLTLVGLSRPVTDADRIPGEVAVNATTVFKGPIPFSLKALSTHHYPVPAAALRKGENKLSVRNLASEGPLGNRPWFGIHRAELRVAEPRR